MNPTIIPATTLHKRGHSTSLVVLLHGFNQTAGRMAQVQRVVEDDDANADILAPSLPFSYTSIAYPSHLVADLLMQIDQAFEKSRQDGAPGYQRILLIGHSMGALFARKLYVCACGERPQAPFEERLKEYLETKNGLPLLEERPWASKVERIILLAAMNRGWSISHHQSLLNATMGRIGLFLGRIIGLLFGRMPIIYSVRRGASFLTQLRLQWLFMRRAAQSGPDPKSSGNALTVQLLGSVDDLISPNDNIDLVAGQDFIYLDVPESNHSTIVELDDSEKRRDVFKRALSQSVEELRDSQVLPEDVIPIPEEKVTDVVFVIHGIRDEGYWTQKIARRVMAEGKKNKRTFAAETSSYGYFPMLSFLSAQRRREKVEWLMDQYVEACARYPNVKRFHYVGHSNGTYLLARALSEYPACRFDRVVFAGSVVRRHYNWQQFIDRDQVGAVLNFMASQDWVVAYFPKGLQSLNLQDLGSAGHDGFKKGERIFQPEVYIQGGHSAALQESMWDAIATFVVSDPMQIPAVPPGLLSTQRSWLVRYPVWPVIWLLLAAFIWAGYRIIIYYAPAEWDAAFVLVYLFVLWNIVTKG